MFRNSCVSFFFNRTIISKDETSSPFANIFQLVIEDYNLMFHYQPVTGNASVASYTLLQSQSEKLQPNEWHLITVAIINKGLSYYIDGEFMSASSLIGNISDQGGGFRIGQRYGGNNGQRVYNSIDSRSLSLSVCLFIHLFIYLTLFTRG